MTPTWNVRTNRDEVALLMEAGFILTEARRFDEAKEVFTGVRALQPANDVAEVALGRIAFHTGDHEQARKHYRRALEIDPQSAFALVHLGEVEIFAKNQEAGRQHLKKAMEIDPRGSNARLARTLMTVAEKANFK